MNNKKTSAPRRLHKLADSCSSRINFIHTTASLRTPWRKSPQTISTVLIDMFPLPSGGSSLTVLKSCPSRNRRKRKNNRGTEKTKRNKTQIDRAHDEIKKANGNGIVTETTAREGRGGVGLAADGRPHGRPPAQTGPRTTPSQDTPRLPLQGSTRLPLRPTNEGHAPEEGGHREGAGAAQAGPREWGRVTLGRGDPPASLFCIVVFIAIVLGFS